MFETLKIQVTDETGRIDKVIATHFTELSRSQVQQWLKDGLVTVNNKVVKANQKIVSGDTIVIQKPIPQELDLVAEDIPVEIVYEDQDVAVVNKPQGMVVHPAAGHASGTLVNALLFHLKDLSTINDIVRPGIVHRIDKDTSGLLMVAKNDKAHESLAAQLKAKTSLRKYIALVHGVIENETGTIDAPIARARVDRKMQAVDKDGKAAVTHFKVLERFDQFTLIECQLETGRTHQIRVHMKYIGFPISGDPIYGPKKTLAGNGQYLHAALLGFEQPTTKEWLQFEATLPENFQKQLTILRNND